MKKLILCLLIILGMSCNTKKQEIIAPLASNVINITKYERLENNNSYNVFTSEPYELSLKLNQRENDLYDLVVNLQLNNGSYYVSPNATREFKGKLTLKFDDNKIIKTSKLIETPLSVEEYDPHPFVNGPVNWVRENTSYKQQIKRISDEDFIIFGVIQFTIEPRCTLEKIPFFIKYADGKMQVEINRC